MNKYQKVFLNVLEKISFDKEEEKELDKRVENVKKILNKTKLNIQIGGSFAKKTLIKKDKQDVDFFVLFNDKKELSKFESKIKTLKLNGDFVHGSRDYYVFEYEGLIIEVIPVLNYKKLEEVENVTDFSLKHVDYVSKKIRKNKKLSDEIRLAKSFCRASETYGAESYIQGFSGYALEVLIIHFGSFLNLLKNISKQSVIDPEKQFKNKSEILRELNESKLASPIILIDPVYKYRNVCAGLSKETYEKFLRYSQEFLKNPLEDFFEKKNLDLANIKEKAKNNNLSFLKIEFYTEKQAGDVAGTKMKKAFNFLIRQLGSKQQEIVEKYFVYNEEYNNSQGYLVFKEKNSLEIKGPEKSRKKAVEKFRKVRKDIYFKKGFAWTKEEFNLADFFKKQKSFVEGMDVSFKVE